MAGTGNGDADLPEGWAFIKLGEGLINDVQPGFACGAHNRAGDGIPHLRPMNVSVEGRIDLADVKYIPASTVDKKERLVEYGDVLFNNTNSPALVGKTACYLDSSPRAFSNHMTRLRCRAGFLDPQYCAIALHHQWRLGHFESICNNHISQASIGRGVLLDTEIPLPPLAEQQRIVAKVESLLARVQAVRERLARVPLILKRFRQAVLAAACDGRLTADWRSSVNPDRESDDEHQPESEMPSVPVAWKYEVAADVVQSGTVITYGIVLPGPNRADGVPYIRGQDINDAGHILVDQLWRTSPEIAAKHKRSELCEGDVLLCVIRHLRVAIVPSGIDGANLTQGTVRLRPSDRITARYLASYLASPQAQGWMKTRYIGMAMPRINVEHARSIPIAVPTVMEQHEIVRRVDALFKLAEGIERRLTAAAPRAEKLSQSILARAFRGELVPTEAELAEIEGREYESAEQLLDRLRSAPSTKGMPRSRRKKAVAAADAEVQRHRVKSGQVVLDLLLLLDAWNKPVSIHVLEPALLLLRNDAARETLLKGSATPRRRRALEEPPQFIVGLDLLYGTLAAKGIIERVGDSAWKLLKPDLIQTATAAERRKVAAVVRAIEALNDVRRLPAIVAELTHERYEVTV